MSWKVFLIGADYQPCCESRCLICGTVFTYVGKNAFNPKKTCNHNGPCPPALLDDLRRLALEAELHRPVRYTGSVATPKVSYADVARAQGLKPI